MRWSVCLVLWVYAGCSQLGAYLPDNLAWETHFGGSSTGRSLVVTPWEVCVAGHASGNTSSWRALAFDRASGQLLWLDHLSGPSAAYDATSSGHRVFVCGSRWTATPFDNDTEWVVRAIDARNGQKLWEDIHGATSFNTPWRITSDGSRVFAAGNAPDPGADIKVRAYDTATGTNLWQALHEFDADANEYVRDIDANGAVVAVAGDLYSYTTWHDFFVAAFDAATGNVLWTDRFDQAGESDGAQAVAVGPHRVFVAGSSSSGGNVSSFLVRAYDLAGTLVWQDTIDGVQGSARAIAVDSGLVHAVGHVSFTDGRHGQEMILRTYDAVSGTLQWERRAGGDVGLATGQGVAAENGLVYTTGTAKNRIGLSNMDLLVAVHNASDGTLVWSDLHDFAGSLDYVFDLKVDSGQVFTTGFFNTHPVLDWQATSYIRTYKD